MADPLSKEERDLVRRYAESAYSDTTDSQKQAVAVMILRLFDSMGAMEDELAALKSHAALSATKEGADGRDITRREALEISHDTMERAEAARREYDGGGEEGGMDEDLRLRTAQALGWVLGDGWSVNPSSNDYDTAMPNYGHDWASCEEIVAAIQQRGWVYGLEADEENTFVVIEDCDGNTPLGHGEAPTFPAALAEAFCRAVEEGSPTSHKANPPSAPRRVGIELEDEQLSRPLGSFWNEGEW